MRGTSRHCGVAGLIVLVLLTVTSLIAAAMARSMVQQQQQHRLWRRQLQAVWLAESGLERAVAQLTRDPAYTGESWALSAEELGGAFPAAVRIQASTVEGQPLHRAVTVVADYPADLPQRARHTESALVELQPSGDAS